MITQEELAAFFNAHLGESVGKSGDGGCCPIARALKAKYGAECAQAEADVLTVTHYHVAGIASSSIAKTEPWQAAFMVRVDNAQEYPFFRDVTGAEALAILKEVQACNE